MKENIKEMKLDFYTRVDVINEDFGVAQKKVEDAVAEIKKTMHEAIKKKETQLEDEN
tara:strand:- start:351 stop:521 length:171 start_codon:yes stop_codon:yes gene_type:complete